MAGIRLFEGAKHIEAYAKFRPTSPQKVAEIMIDYLKKSSPLPESGRYSLLLDIGCGSGQSTAIFAPYFETLVGIDPSSNQIMQANKSKLSNISYMEGNSENLGQFQNESVDLITCGQSAHWFEMPKFLKECRRVLKPNGCLLLHGYDRPMLCGKADVLMKDYYYFFEWNEKLKVLDHHYKELFDVLNCENKMMDESVKIERDMNLANFHGYLSTWSAYPQYLQTEGANPNILKDFVKSLKKFWRVEDKKDENIDVKVTYDCFMVMSTRPIISE